eukprot:scaffold16.g83.t1
MQSRVVRRLVIKLVGADAATAVAATGAGSRRRCQQQQGEGGNKKKKKGLLDRLNGQANCVFFYQSAFNRTALLGTVVGGPDLGRKRAQILSFLHSLIENPGSTAPPTGDASLIRDALQHLVDRDIIVPLQQAAALESLLGEDVTGKMLKGKQPWLATQAEAEAAGQQAKERNAGGSSNGESESGGSSNGESESSGSSSGESECDAGSSSEEDEDEAARGPEGAAAEELGTPRAAQAAAAPAQEAARLSVEAAPQAGAEAAEKAPSKPASDCELETEVESEEEDEVEGGKAVHFKPNKQEENYCILLIKQESGMGTKGYVRRVREQMVAKFPHLPPRICPHQ